MDNQDMYRNMNGGIDNSREDYGYAQERKFPKPGPVAGIVVMLLETVISFYLLSRAQYYLGMWGLVITELAFVVISLGAAWVVDLRVKEMLPFNKLKVNQFFGTIVMWLGSLFLIIIVNLLFFYYFPAGLDVNDSINTFLNEWPLVPMMFVVSVMPAICEEMLHRGFIQRCMMRKIKSRMLICLIMGLFFGLFHMDFYRFIGTAVFGWIISYVLVITENFFYNMLLHFTNNFMVQIISILIAEPAGRAKVAMTKELILAGLGSYLIIGCLTPLVLLGGAYLLKGIDRIKEEGTVKLVVSIGVAVLISALMFIAGVIVLFGNMNILHDIGLRQIFVLPVKIICW